LWNDPRAHTGIFKGDWTIGLIIPTFHYSLSNL
jgi:hypothetical protein